MIADLWVYLTANAKSVKKPFNKELKQKLLVLKEHKLHKKLLMQTVLQFKLSAEKPVKFNKIQTHPDLIPVHKVKTHKNLNQVTK